MSVFVAIIVHLFFIFYIASVHNLMTNYTYWIICLLCHAIMWFVMIILGSVILYSKQKGIVKNNINKKLFYIVAFMYLYFGAAISLVSNLMHPNVSAYVILCLATAVFFTTYPVISIIYNVFVYIAWALLLPLFQNDRLSLINDRNNSFVAVLISIIVSFIMWHYNVKLIEQKRVIEEQNIELQDKIKNIEFLATHDELTGILNRYQFQCLGKLEISNLRRSNDNLSLIITDIDNFKKINDKFGHPAGDLILRDFSGLLIDFIRKTDIMARFGGDEFVILLPGMTVDEAKEKAEMLRKTIELHKFICLADNDQVTASFGIASIDSVAENPLIVGYKNADCALYKAKQLGRNRVEVYQTR